ncbi:hypothetical protein HXX76_010494 [Chlamydomonas incerta]|uniref:type I protein arginine methyltransferase n=1 Tax=Chlamydomonas incerta TaxID=51695 RepID=A0A835SJU7_CHLIN|nr:hypothetical protein HXX76_010494 [Chlamydomonas incerta]|eukprot:KAG2428349.1 hypothetical protein HXX76_010494 [Chlamydomonas incerta]
MTGGVQVFGDLRVALVHPETGAIGDWDAAQAGCKLIIRSGQGAPQLSLEQANGGSFMQCVLSSRTAWRAGPTLFFLSPQPGGAGGPVYGVRCCSSSSSSSHGDSGSSSNGGGRAAADQLQAALDAALAVATGGAAAAGGGMEEDGHHGGACDGGPAAAAGSAAGRRNPHGAASNGAAAPAPAAGAGGSGRPAAGSKRAADDLNGGPAAAHGANGGAASNPPPPPAAAATAATPTNAFDAKTDRASSDMYFHYYGQLQHQQNMLQDYTRTGTYYSAIVGNPADFAGRTVMDVGAGSGILSLFAAQAGAARVYAVEASGAARWAAALAAANGGAGGGVITVLNSKVEELDLGGERVDVLVSEPMGTLLLNERMLESYLHARDRFLKPGGKMFPCLGRIHADVPLPGPHTRG